MLFGGEIGILLKEKKMIKIITKILQYHKRSAEITNKTKIRIPQSKQKQPEGTAR